MTDYDINGEPKLEPITTRPILLSDEEVGPTDTDRVDWLATRLNQVRMTSKHMILDWIDEKGNDFFSVTDYIDPPMISDSRQRAMFRVAVDSAMEAERELLEMDKPEYDQSVMEHRAMRKVYR
jgi:hypothetical protein